MRIVSQMRSRLGRLRPFSSARYWEQRYHQGGNSGAGSYGKFAEYKAQVINDHVLQNGINSAIEFGCGDGNQASILKIPEYTGVDVSRTAVRECQRKMGTWPGRRFFHVSQRAKYAGQYDLVLSLDVIFHLVEDAVFDNYMHRLFEHASKSVLIYSSDHDESLSIRHVRHRCHSAWVAANRSDWKPINVMDNPHSGPWPEGSFAFFTAYAPRSR